MKAIQAYLNFDGNTRAAMEFYQQGLGGELSVQTFGDMDPTSPPEKANFVIHARIMHGAQIMLMASDSMPGQPLIVGNNVWLNCDCSSLEEQDRVFAAFGAGGKVEMPLAEQFWGARFGMLTDKFGVHWMFNCDLPKK